MRAWFDCVAPVVMTDVAPLLHGIGDEEFELARLVPAERQAGQIVALDEDARRLRRPAERLAQARHVLQRRGQRGERQARNVDERGP
jgi:hypothetical protein